MSTRYDDRDDRDYDRDSQYYGQYNRRSSLDNTRSFGERSENRWGESRYGESGREGYWGRGWENERDDDARESRFGRYGRSGAERGYSEGMRESSQRYNYPTGFRSNESYGGRGSGNERDRYDSGE